MCEGRRSGVTLSGPRGDPLPGPPCYAASRAPPRRPHGVQLLNSRPRPCEPAREHRSSDTNLGRCPSPVMLRCRVPKENGCRCRWREPRPGSRVPPEASRRSDTRRVCARVLHACQRLSAAQLGEKVLDQLPLPGLASDRVQDLARDAGVHSAFKRGVDHLPVSALERGPE